MKSHQRPTAGNNPSLSRSARPKRHSVPDSFWAYNSSWKVQSAWQRASSNQRIFLIPLTDRNWFPLFFLIFNVSWRRGEVCLLWVFSFVTSRWAWAIIRPRSGAEEPKKAPLLYRRSATRFWLWPSNHGLAGSICMATFLAKADSSPTRTFEIGCKFIVRESACTDNFVFVKGI